MDPSKINKHEVDSNLDINKLQKQSSTLTKRYCNIICNIPYLSMHLFNLYTYLVILLTFLNTFSRTLFISLPQEDNLAEENNNSDVRVQEKRYKWLYTSKTI